MHEKYVKLFEELSRTVAITAEQVMDYDKSKNDDSGFKTAETMRNDFQELTDRIKTAGKKYELTKNDAAKLLVGAIIITNQLQGKVNTIQKSIAGYQSDIIPKLQAVVDAKDEDAALQIASEKFVIKNEE